GPASFNVFLSRLIVFTLSNPRSDKFDRFINLDAIGLGAIEEAERHCICFNIAGTCQQHERNLAGGVVANLFLHAVIRGINLSADAHLAQLRDHLFKMLDVVFRHWNAHHLVRCQPRWESTRVVLQQHTEETLDRTEECTVDHDWLLLRAIRSRVFEVETLWHIEVKLNSRHLPGTTNGVARLDRDLRAVEGSTFWVWHQVQAGLFCNAREDFRRALPDFIRTDRLLWITGREFQVEIIQAVVFQQGDNEVQDRRQFFFQLLVGAVDMSIILGKSASAGKTMNNARFLITVHIAKFKDTQRKLTVGAATGIKD